MTALGTRKLTMLIDGVERSPEVSKVTVASKKSESDFLSFAMAAEGGGIDWSLKGTAAQDLDEDSLLNLILEHAGEDVDVTVRPYGNAVPSDTEPHFTGTVTVKAPDGDLIGGEASASSTAKFTFEFEWQFTEKPTKVTGGTSPSITAVSPDTGAQDSVVVVSITGSNFDPSPTVTVSGTGVTVSDVSRPTSALIYATFTVGASAALTNRSVTVTNVDATTVTSTGAFEVTA